VSVTKVELKNPKAGRKVRWEAMWYAEGRQVTARFDTKAEAQAHEARMRTALADGTYLSPRRGQVTVSEFAAWYFTHSRASASTKLTYTGYFRNHVEPILGARRLCDVRREHIVEFVTAAEQRLAPSTVKLVYNIVAMLFRGAVEDQRIARTPCRGVALPPIPRHEAAYLTSEQARQLLACADPQHRGPIAVALGTGLRQGEVLGLRLRNLHWIKPAQLEVRQAVKNESRTPPYLGSLKTPSSRRVVPMPNLVAEAIAAHLRLEPTDDVVFRSPHGELWRRGSFNASVWKPSLERAGLPASLGFHALRHTYASGLIAAGVHPRVIMARLGHASIDETMNTYGHLMPDSIEQTSAAIDSLFGRESGDLINRRGHAS
jgi:integrase